MRARMLITVTLALLLAGAGCTTVTTKPGLGAGPNTPPGEKPFSMAKFTRTLKGQSRPKGPSAVADDDPVTLSSKRAKPKADLYTSMALVQERSNNQEEAEKLFERALQIEPDNLAALVAYAHMQQRRGEIESATRLYKRAVAKHPKNSAVHNDLGVCYHQRQMLNDAHKMLQRAVDLQPDRALYRNNLATLLVDLDRGDEALKNLLLANPPAAAHYNLGYLLHRKGDDQQAVEQFREAAKLDPAMQAASQWIAKLTAPLNSDNAPPQLASRPQSPTQVRLPQQSNAPPKAEKVAASGPWVQPTVEPDLSTRVGPLPPAESSAPKMAASAPSAASNATVESPSARSVSVRVGVSAPAPPAPQTSALPKVPASAPSVPSKVTGESSAVPAMNVSVPPLPAAEISTASQTAAGVPPVPSKATAKSMAVPAVKTSVPQLPAAEISTAAKLAISPSSAPSKMIVKFPEPAASASSAPQATASASSESRLVFRLDTPRAARDGQRVAPTLPNSQVPTSTVAPLPIAAHILRPQNVEIADGPAQNDDLAAQPPRDRDVVKTVRSVTLEALPPPPTTRIILR